MDKKDIIQKIEIKTASLLSRSSQFKSQEQIGNEIMMFSDEIAELFSLQDIDKKNLLIDFLKFLNQESYIECNCDKIIQKYVVEYLKSIK